MKIPIMISTIGLLFFFTEWITLEDLRWKNRIILIFPSSDEFLFEINDSLKVEIEIRDVVYFVFADSLYSNKDYQLEDEYIEKLKAKYLLGTKTDCWVLVGKDGGMKLRREEGLDWHEALQAIDDRAEKGELVSW